MRNGAIRLRATIVAAVVLSAACLSYAIYCHAEADGWNEIAMANSRLLEKISADCAPHCDAYDRLSRQTFDAGVKTRVVADQYMGRAKLFYALAAIAPVLLVLLFFTFRWIVSGRLGLTSQRNI